MGLIPSEGAPVHGANSPPYAYAGPAILAADVVFALVLYPKSVNHADGSLTPFNWDVSIDKQNVRLGNGHDRAVIRWTCAKNPLCTGEIS